MRKFLAIVKHEYRKIVLRWTFLVGTLLFPLLAAGFAVVPSLIFSMKGEATRLAVVDHTGKISQRLKNNLTAEVVKEKAGNSDDNAIKDMTASPNEKIKRQTKEFGESFIFVDYDAAEKSDEQIRRELSDKIVANQLDAYLIIPKDLSESDSRYEFFSRKAGDFVVNSRLEDALNEAVRSQRLADADINEAKLKNLSQNINLDKKAVDEKGEEKDLSGIWGASFVISMMIYITLAIYGQMIMGSVVEEKETRIAEILFSSAKPFELMLGKLVGVGLAGLTQLAIWIISAVILATVGLAQLSAAGVNIAVPEITPLMILLFFVYFLIGFFLYASIFALIGSMVTTVQEGGQFAFPPIMLLLAAFYFSFAVIRDPNSSLSFWVSIAPFFAPITMPVRILAETPPFWQIALSILVNGAAIAGLVWLASRVYRIGMLMYGKRATIPEVWKWIRQA